MMKVAETAVRPIACPRCAATYDPHAWRGLLVAERIHSHEVRQILLYWPEAYCIEVRVCATCRHRIAARSEAV